jgi:capsular polysaccharide biosynthesis protein
MHSMPLIIPSREEELAGLNIECLEPEAFWTRAPADFVVDLSGGQIEHSLSGAQPGHRHGSYRNRFSDVLVFGHHHFHGILGSNGRIDCQEIGATQRRLDTHLHYHPGRNAPIPQVYRSKKGYRVNFAKMECEELDGVLYFGTPIEPLNWGMWLLQAVPNAIDFLSHGQAERFFAYVGRDWQRRLLTTLGIPEEKLVNQELGYTYHCEDLILRQFSQIDLVPTPTEMDVFARVARDIAGVEKVTASRRLFLSRRSVTRESEGKYRALLNEEALVEAFAARGYEVVEPELLSFADQIRLFAEADLVIGLGGAALFNVIFSPATTRIVSIESGVGFAHNHACLFAALGHRFGFIFGRQDPEDETPVQKRWTIDVEGVMRALSQYE